MLDPKKQLHITLTEPIVFLRTPDPSGRLESDPSDPPTLVRGILTLNVSKPIGISTIEVELTGVLAVNYSETIGSRRIDLPEEHRIYSSTVAVFRADQVSRGRSVGPGLSTANPNESEHAATNLSRSPSLPRGRPERRGVAGTALDLGPSPPYTVTQPPTSIQSGFGGPGGHPARAPEELTHALRENSEGQTGSILPSSHSPIPSPLPNATMHSSVSSTEDDSRADNSIDANQSSEGDTSYHNTTEEASHCLSHRGPSPSRPVRAHSPENTHGAQPSTRAGSHDPLNAPAGHSRLRLSLTSVLDAVREMTSRTPSRSRSVAGSEDWERGRTRLRRVAEEQGTARNLEAGERAAGLGNDNQAGPSASHSSGHTEHREYHLLGLGHVFGLERNHEKDKDGEHKHKEHGECWREFKPGTYSYPISFMLPPHLPPTFSLPNGSLSYAIKGVAHRPGTFTSKLSCQVPLVVVAAPAVGTGEGGGAGDPGPILVQRQWEGKLAYSFGLSSRLFLLGSERRLRAAASESVDANSESLAEAAVEARAEVAYGTAMLDLTLLPIEKVKIWRLDIAVDQRIRYIDERGRPFREDDRRHVKLLELQDTCPAEEMDLMDEEEQLHKHKHKHKHDPERIPLLPTPISPHRSPLLRYLSPSADPSILAGPGPYTLSTSIGLPGCNDPSSEDSRLLHFTVKQRSSNVRVEHSLRLVMRVESVGDNDTNGHEEGEKRRLFDIAVQTPISILSCRCIPEYQTLPRYSRVTEDCLQNCVACPCQPNTPTHREQDHGHETGINFGHIATLHSTSSFSSESDEHRDNHERPTSPPHARSSGHASSLTVPLSPHSHPPSPASWPFDAIWNRSPSHVQTHFHARHSSLHAQPHSAASTSHDVHSHSEAPPLSTPHPSRPPSPLAQYDRLVSGLESEAGEAPPSYESVASAP